MTTPLMPAVTAGQLVIDWITSLGWDGRQELGFPLNQGPFIPPGPDKLVTITVTGGPGYTHEATLDNSIFQARVRGGANDQAGAELAATLLDKLILTAQFPAVIDGETIVHVHRFGSSPSPLGGTPAPDEGYRYEYTANYVLVTGEPNGG